VVIIPPYIKMLYFDWLMAMIFFANFKRICAFFPPRDISDQDHPLKSPGFVYAPFLPQVLYTNTVP
jgi:hypothetical protein